MSIKALLLDADGVVVLPHQFARYLESEHGISIDTTLSFFKGNFQECLVGRADLRGTLAPLVPAWGWRGSTEEFIAAWLETSSLVDERILEVVRALRRAGLSCGLASNQERIRAQFMRTQMGFVSEFDDLFFSCDVGHRKPEREYYSHVAASLGLTGEEILFWDDDSTHVEAARECGWHAERYVCFEAFQERLTTLLSAMPRP